MKRLSSHLAVFALLVGATTGFSGDVKTGGPCGRDTGFRLGQPVGVSPPSIPIVAFSAYVDGNWDIFTWDFRSDHKPIQWTRTPFDESSPSLAYDGLSCVYETVDGKLWRLKFESGAKPEQVPFGSDQKLDMHPSISPDGRTVAMATSLDRTTDDTDLIVYQFDSKSFRPPMALLSFQHYPAWAPDGKHLAFANLHGRLWTGKPISEIWIMRTDAPWARQLTLLDGLSISPSWSPAGDRIVFSGNHEGNFDLWMVDTRTRDCTRVTHHPAADTDPVFGRNGNALLFVSTRGGELGIWKLNLSTQEVEPVRPFGDQADVPTKDPDWK